MSFESKMKKRGNKNLNKFAKNPYHKSWFSRIPIWTKVLVPSALAAGLIIGVFVGVLPNMTSKASANLKTGDSGYQEAALNDDTGSNNKGYHSYAPGAPSSATASQHNDSSSIAEWTSLSIPEKYHRITYNNSYYYYYSDVSPLEVENVGDLLQTGVIAEGGNYQGGVFEKQTDDVSIYTVKNFANRIIVAAKLLNDNNYYLYFSNSDIAPYNILEDLFNDIPLNIVCETNEAYFECYKEGYELYGYYGYEGIEKSQVMSIIFNDLTAPSSNNAAFPQDLIKKVNEYNKKITVSINFPVIHINSPSLALSSAISILENGCLEATMFGRKQTYYVGSDVYQTFEAYLFNNFTGTKIS